MLAGRSSGPGTGRTTFPSAGRGPPGTRSWRVTWRPERSIFLETGDERLLDTAVAQWEDMVSCRMYVTGGVGSRHKDESFGDPFELPPDRAYCETCAAVATVMWGWRLLLATGEPGTPM